MTLTETQVAVADRTLQALEAGERPSKQELEQTKHVVWASAEWTAARCSQLFQVSRPTILAWAEAGLLQKDQQRSTPGKFVFDPDSVGRLFRVLSSLDQWGETRRAPLADLAAALDAYALRIPAPRVAGKRRLAVPKGTQVK